MFIKMSIQHYLTTNQESASAEAYIKALKVTGSFNYKAADLAADRGLVLDANKVAQWAAIAANPGVYGNQIDIKFIRSVIPLGAGSLEFDRSLVNFNPLLYILDGVPKELTLRPTGRYLILCNFVTKEGNSSIEYKINIEGQANQVITQYNISSDVIPGVETLSNTTFFGTFTTDNADRKLTITTVNDTNQLELDVAESYITLFYLSA